MASPTRRDHAIGRQIKRGDGVSVYLVCKKRKNQRRSYMVCLALKCSNLEHDEKGYSCNYKTKDELRVLKRVKSDPYLVTD